MKKDSREILSFEALRIGYADRRNKNVLLPPITASARRGEMIALIGKNGIGKSTLLRTLAGLQSSLGGDITYGGKALVSIHEQSLPGQSDISQLKL